MSGTNPQLLRSWKRQKVVFPLKKVVGGRREGGLNILSDRFETQAMIGVQPTVVVAASGQCLLHTSLPDTSQPIVTSLPAKTEPSFQAYALLNDEVWKWVVLSKG